LFEAAARLALIEVTTPHWRRKRQAL